MSIRLHGKLVVHEKDGSVLKGITSDFLAKRHTFHLKVRNSENGFRRIHTPTLKAVFFVKSFNGNENHHEKMTFPHDPPPGKRVKATFIDGETMYGYTHMVNHMQSGFFLVPADPTSNNERVFVVFDALSDLVIEGVRVPLQVGIAAIGFPGGDRISRTGGAADVDRAGQGASSGSPHILVNQMR